MKKADIWMKLKNIYSQSYASSVLHSYTAVEKHYTQTAAVYEWSTEKVITLRAYVFQLHPDVSLLHKKFLCS